MLSARKKGGFNATQCPEHANTTGMGKARFDQCICPPGRFMNASNECQQCGIGYYCTGDNTRSMCPGTLPPRKTQTICTTKD